MRTTKLLFGFLIILISFTKPAHSNDLYGRATRSWNMWGDGRTNGNHESALNRAAFIDRYMVDRGGSPHNPWDYYLDLSDGGYFPGRNPVREFEELLRSFNLREVVYYFQDINAQPQNFLASHGEYINVEVVNQLGPHRKEILDLTDHNRIKRRFDSRPIKLVEEHGELKLYTDTIEGRTPRYSFTVDWYNAPIFLVHSALMKPDKALLDAMEKFQNEIGAPIWSQATSVLKQSSPFPQNVIEGETKRLLQYENASEALNTLPNILQLLFSSERQNFLDRCLVRAAIDENNVVAHKLLEMGANPYAKVKPFGGGSAERAYYQLKKDQRKLAAELKPNLRNNICAFAFGKAASAITGLIRNAGVEKPGGWGAFQSKAK